MDLNITYIVTVIVVILLSMTFHEAMHAFMSHWLGDSTAKLSGRLSLNPIKHIDPFMTILLPIMLAVLGLPIFGGAKPVPFNPNNLKWGEWGPALVALAGPMTNLLIAFISFGLYVIFNSSGTTPAGDFLGVAVSVNLGFFIFNMLPIPPLDGSRVLYSLAPEPVRRGMESVERYGVMIVFLIIFLAGPMFSQFMMASIKFFISVFAHVFGA